MLKRKNFQTLMMSVLLVSWASKDALSSDRQALLHEGELRLESEYFPSGWMGKPENIKIETVSNEECGRPEDQDKQCHKFSYVGNHWAGVYWLTPLRGGNGKPNWGDQPGFHLDGPIRLTFWVRGEFGDERVEFKAGGIRDREYRDSFSVSLGTRILSKDWERLEIRLEGRDLSQVIGGFAWISPTGANPNGLTFYIDAIKYAVE